MTLLEAMPDYDVREYHQIIISAPKEEVYQTMKTMDFRASPIVRALLFIRSGGRKVKAVTLQSFWQRGFLLLSDIPNDEVLLGLVGRFWTPTGSLLTLPPTQFLTFEDPSYAKTAFNFQLHDHPTGTLLTTETRVKCFRNPERIFFRCYWTVIRPFSGLIRKEMLRQIRVACQLRNTKK